MPELFRYTDTWEDTVIVQESGNALLIQINDEYVSVPAPKWPAIAAAICPSDHVILPRAEVEALRARAERLRRIATMVDQYDKALMDDHADLPVRRPYVEAFINWSRRLQPGDLADDLRDLDDLPPLEGEERWAIR